MRSRVVRPATRRAVLLLPLNLLAACSSAPTQVLLGSFFPSWLICALLGVLAAALASKLLGLVHVAEHVPAAPLIYAAFAAAVALLVWLLRFAH